MRAPNPFVIFVWLCVVVFLSLAVLSLISVLTLFAATLVVASFVHGDEWKIYMKYSTITASLILCFNLLLSGGWGNNVLFKYYFITISSESLLFSLMMVFKFLAIVSAFGVFSSTVRIEDLITVLERLRIPDKALVTAVISLSVFPVLTKDAKEITEVFYVRGMNCEKKSMRDRIKARMPLLISLAETALERGMDLAQTLELRGYPSRKRNPWKKIKLQLYEKIIVLILVSLVPAYFTLAYFFRLQMLEIFSVMLTSIAAISRRCVE